MISPCGTCRNEVFDFGYSDFPPCQEPCASCENKIYKSCIECKYPELRSSECSRRSTKRRNWDDAYRY